MSVGSRRFHTLDAMRGAAALAVAIYHFRERTETDIYAGYLAVDLFFVLSGFVIALNYDHRMAAGMSATRFMELRLIRLYPLYFAGWALGLAKHILGHMLGDPRAMSAWVLTTAAAFHLFVLPDVLDSALFPLNGPAWSLFFEVIASLAFAVVLSRGGTRVLGLTSLMSGIYLLGTIRAPDFFDVGWAWANAGGGLARTLFSFSNGMLIARHLSPRRYSSWMAPLLVIATIVVVCSRVPSSFQLPYQFLAVGIVFPLLLVGGAQWEPPSCAIPAAALLGDLSYPIYAIHWPLIAITGSVIGRLHGGSCPLLRSVSRGTAGFELRGTSLL